MSFVARIRTALGALAAACVLVAPAAAQQPTTPPKTPPPAPAPAPAPITSGAPSSVSPLPQAGAPTGQCDLLVTPNSDSTHFTSTKLPSGEYNNFIGGGVTGHCPVQQITLISDSAEWFGDLHMWHLIGHVHYTEPRITMDSDVSTYFLTDEHLLSEGNVHATLPSGTTLVGPRVEYYRASPKIRPVARMIAPGRPTINVIEKDSTGKQSEPTVVVANTVVMDGDSLMYASQNVVITRTECRGHRRYREHEQPDGVRAAHAVTQDRVARQEAVHALWRGDRSLRQAALDRARARQG